MNAPRGWINAVDKLPEAGKRIICCGITGEIMFIDSVIFRMLALDSEQSARNLMHWMDAPIPPPTTPYPKKDQS